MALSFSIPICLYLLRAVATQKGRLHIFLADRLTLFKPVSTSFLDVAKALSLIVDLIISQMYSPAAVSWLLVLLTLDKNFFFKVGFDV